MNYTSEELQKRFAELPDDLQDLLFSSDLPAEIAKISKENGLQEKQTAELSDETGLVLLGITNPSQFIPNIKSRLGLQLEAAKKVADSINERIFRPVRLSLLKIHDGANGKNAEQIRAPQPIQTAWKPRNLPETDTDHMLPGETTRIKISAAAKAPTPTANAGNTENVKRVTPAINLLAPTARIAAPTQAPIPEPPKVMQTLEEDFNKAARMSAQTIAGEKLSRPVSMPPEEKRVDGNAGTPPKPQYGSDGKYIDPYREPF